MKALQELYSKLSCPCEKRIVNQFCLLKEKPKVYLVLSKIIDSLYAKCVFPPATIAAKSGRKNMCF